MSVIAWDGKTLAADRFADMCGARGTTNKLFLLPTNEVFGFTGALSTGHHLMELYRTDRLFSHWPETQSSDDWARMLIGKSDGTVVYIERSPAEIPLYVSRFAAGSGQDFALGAMYMGANAETAVKVANELCASCGNGVTAFKYTGGFWKRVP